MTGNANADHIRALELARCAALTRGDVAALGRLVADDLVHVHASGTIDDRARYLADVTDKYVFHVVERGPLRIDPRGGAIAVHGPMTHIVSRTGDPQRHTVHLFTTQLWVETADGWRQAVCHSSYAAAAA